MTLHLFAGIPVRDFGTALAWYERLLGRSPSMLPRDTEAVWELADQASVFIVELPDRAGYADHTVIVEDLDEAVAGITARGIEHHEVERYANGIRKVVYRDPDGNEISFGGLSHEPA